MKRMTQTVLAGAVALAAFAGLAQAGRGSDYAVAPQAGVATERAGNAGGMTYAGRPSDMTAIVPARSEEMAEFAVMDVQGGSTARGAGAYYGSRPMDNPIR